MIRHAVLISLAAVALANCAPAAPSITVETPEVRASLGNTSTAAAYLTLRNSGGADRLVGASCECAGMVMTHQTVVTDGVSRMVHEASVDVPAGGSVVFAPGGRHLMLTGVTAPIRAGSEVTITLRFERSGDVPVVFTAVDTPSAAHAGH
jgi:copper(I)-binding protein